LISRFVVSNTGIVEHWLMVLLSVFVLPSLTLSSRLFFLFLSCILSIVTVCSTNLFFFFFFFFFFNPPKTHQHGEEAEEEREKIREKRSNTFEFRVVMQRATASGGQQCSDISACGTKAIRREKDEQEKKTKTCEQKNVNINWRKNEAPVS
jgi:hypothetical protein